MPLENDYWLESELRSLFYDLSIAAWEHYNSLSPEEWFWFLLDMDEVNPFYRQWADNLFALDFLKKT
jgi:hypothetical protein